MIDSQVAATHRFSGWIGLRDRTVLAGRGPRMPIEEIDVPGGPPGVLRACRLLRRLAFVVERQACGVDAVALSAGVGAVVEEVAQVCVARGAADLGADHAVLP